MGNIKVSAHEWHNFINRLPNEAKLKIILGTWVPLQSGRDLALRNGVFEKLRPIFDYIPGDISPPQAPKHTTAASNKPKIPKPAPMRRAPSTCLLFIYHWDVLVTNQQNPNQCLLLVI